MAAKPVAPTHRHRSKSAPRGRSPDPKALKKAAKEAKKEKTKEKSPAPGSLVTPPPKVKVCSPPTAPKKDPTQRKLSWGKNTVHDVDTEHKKPMNAKEADAILADMKEPPSRGMIWGSNQL